MLCISSYVTGKNIKGDLKIIRRMKIICLIIVSISITFVGFTQNQLIFLLAVTSIAGIALGALLPVLDAIITENIQKEERGTVTSLYSSARFIGVAAGPPVMSLVMENHLNTSYIIAGIIGLLILFYF